MNLETQADGFDSTEVMISEVSFFLDQKYSVYGAGTSLLGVRHLENFRLLRLRAFCRVSSVKSSQALVSET